MYQLLLLPVYLTAANISNGTYKGHLKLVVKGGFSRVCRSKAYDLQNCTIVVELRKGDKY